MVRLYKRLMAEDEKGFTLVELIVVIAIIALLAALAMPKLAGVLSDSGKKSSDANLSGVSDSVVRYELDNGTFPSDAAAGSSATIANALKPKYLKESFSFRNSNKQNLLYATNAAKTAFIVADANDPAVANGDSLTASCTPPGGGAAVTVTWTAIVNQSASLNIVNATTSPTIADFNNCTLNTAAPSKFTTNSKFTTGSKS